MYRINISDSDLLYTQQGYLLGKVKTNGVSNKTITLDDIIYVPAPNTFNEIVKKKKRTVISQMNFQDADALSAINYLAAKRPKNSWHRGIHVFSIKKIIGKRRCNNY